MLPLRSAARAACFACSRVAACLGDPDYKIHMVEASKYLAANYGATGGSGAGYVAIAEAVRAVAAKLGVSPDAVQAAYWIDASGSQAGKQGRRRP